MTAKSVPLPACSRFQFFNLFVLFAALLADAAVIHNRPA